MNDLDWLVNHRFQAAIRNEYCWSFVFDQAVSVKVECLWRVIENGRVRRTNQDDGHQFGLPAPVDAVLEVNQRLAGAAVTSVVLHEGTLDLEIQFDPGHLLQLIPDSAGYEAWAVYELSREFIAVGGGELTIFGCEG